MAFQVKTEFPCCKQAITLPVSSIPEKEVTLTRRCPACQKKWFIGAVRIRDLVVAGEPSTAHRVEWC